MPESETHADHGASGGLHAAAARLCLHALQTRDVDAETDQVVNEIVEALRVDACGLWMADGGSLRFASGVGWGEAAPAGVGSDALEDAHAGVAFTSGEPVVIDDFEEATGLLAAPLEEAHPFRSGACVPVRGEDETVGVLGVYSDRCRSFDQDEIHFLKTAAAALAGVFARRRILERLRESEARSEAVLDTTVDGIITIDAYGKIESFNPAAERIFGYDASEVIGKNVDVLMPQPYKDEHDEYLRSYRETGRRKIIGIGREVVGRRKDGSTFPLDLAVSEVSLGDRRLFTGVVRDITDRRQLEKEILLISEQERRRIGQDLHDGLGQMLTGIGLIARNLARNLERANEEHAEDVAEIAEMLKEADEFARGLARGLVPVDLEANGLRSALQRLAVGAEKLFDVRCTFEERGRVLVEDSLIATHLFRIAQEAVSNAVKHGNAQRVRISLAGGEEQVRLRVHDDGVGFPEHFDIDDNGSGMGVRIMRHRARIMGAHLEIGPGIDGGTTVTCTVRKHGGNIPMGGEEYGRN